MSATWYTARLIDTEEITPATRRFWLQVPEMPVFEFLPGQFITLDLPIGEKPKERWRSYSIASPPDGSNIIELVIVFLEGGHGTEYLFHQMKVGDQVPLMGPLGKFTLPVKIENDLCFICTGTGIAPFRSMIRYILEKDIPHRDIFLIFGTRTIQDILYYKEMMEMAVKMDSLHYIVTLSRERSTDWQGGKGYVHAIYEELFADRRKADLYLCGWRDMIDEARERLKNMGYPSENIHLEIYG